MIGAKVTFKNRPTADGFETITIDDCLIANNGSPNASRPQILIHLPKIDDHVVDGSFIEYEGHEWFVVGTTVQQMDGNTPTRWNRYAIAERIIAL
jgi:hypothetical protein